MSNTMPLKAELFYRFIGDPGCLVKLINNQEQMWCASIREGTLHLTGSSQGLVPISNRDTFIFTGIQVDRVNPKKQMFHTSFQFFWVDKEVQLCLKVGNRYLFEDPPATSHSTLPYNTMLLDECYMTNHIKLVANA